MCPDQVNVIDGYASGRNEPGSVDDRQRAAAWKFYCKVLGGRRVYPNGVAGDETLWFDVGNVLIEAGPQFRNARARMAAAPEVIEDVAARSWDAGFSVEVRDRRRGPPSFRVFDPFGRRIDLVPSSQRAPNEEI
jgi:catechol 2,3-dioxygenase-like lactoylglutathione lyase family enzyme